MGMQTSKKHAEQRTSALHVVLRLQVHPVEVRASGWIERPGMRRGQSKEEPRCLSACAVTQVPT